MLYYNLVPISNTVRVQGPGAALQLLGSLDCEHLPVDVVEPEAVGGQLQQSPEVFLQVAHCLLQAEADGLHPVAPADVHHGAAGAEVHLCQGGQLTVLGDEDVIPGRKQGSCQVTEGLYCEIRLKQLDNNGEICINKLYWSRKNKVKQFHYFILYTWIFLFHVSANMFSLSIYSVFTTKYKNVPLVSKRQRNTEFFPSCFPWESSPDLGGMRASDKDPETIK